MQYIKPDLISRSSSLLEALEKQVQLHPDKTALIFLSDGVQESERFTYRELQECILQYARHIQHKGLAGHRIQLLLPNSPEYVVAFYGCICAGAIPIPAYPPTSSRHMGRLAQMARDSGAQAVIHHEKDLQSSKIRAFTEHLPEGSTCEWMSTHELAAPSSHPWNSPVLQPDTVAYLQYTSGSTSEPRGVMVTHRNLLEHTCHIQTLMSHDQHDVFVTWLPLFHDMGIIGEVIHPLNLGATVVLMPPTAFAQRPTCWLEAISRYQGTVSFAPNFAYEWALQRTDAQLRDTLDLSSWKCAINAAEPVHALTLQRFRDHFAPCGLRPEALNPAYGLAESTLIVTAHPQDTLPCTLEVDQDALEQDGSLCPPTPQGRPRTLVGCGMVQDNLRVKIVNPETCEPCPEGRMGEIWIQGPLVAAGYWQRPEKTRETFQAQLSTGEGPYLRTGDLGILHEGQLFVTGRIKDLVIIRGRNHYPQDIEQTVQEAHLSLEKGRGAVFSIEVNHEERLVVVQEVRRTWRKDFPVDQVLRSVLAEIAEQHGLRPHAMVFLNPGTIPLTSSGKVQRQSCKKAFLQSELVPLYHWESPGFPVDEQDQIAPVRGQTRTAQDITRWLKNHLGNALGLAAESLRTDLPFKQYGLDSLATMVLCGSLSRWLNQPVPVTLPYNYPTVDQMAHHLAGSGEPAGQQRATPLKQMAESVAIIGMACRFPGASSLDAFWTLLEQGQDGISQVPESRWIPSSFQEADASIQQALGQGGFLEGIDAFDAQFFGISPREALLMDPQQRLLLQTTWHALEHAGIVPEQLAGSNTGVFVGVSSTDYRDLLRAHGLARDPYLGTGNSLSITANRISYTFDLQGPSLAVDTACSSSLVALHQARMALLSGACDLAIVGGVNLMLSADTSVGFALAGMLSPEGRCKTFDAGADGYVRSEGCGVIILRRTEDALQNGNPVLACVAGSAVNQDGRSNGLTAPSGLAQQKVMLQALQEAGLSASDVQYVEAHGTGTRLGDPIEFESIQAVYGEVSGENPLWVGSVKTNFGHLEAAAGMAGLIKTVLSMQHQNIPAHLHLKELNPALPDGPSRLSIPQEMQPWISAGQGRAAGVSAFSFGGTNAHVVVTEPPQNTGNRSVPFQTAEQDDWQLLMFSARRENALRHLTEVYLQVLSNLPEDPAMFRALCRSAAVHRAHHPHRLAILARSALEARQALNAHLDGQNRWQVLQGHAQQQPAVGWLFTGQGSQHPQMGLRLYATQPVFREALEACEHIIQGLEGWSLLEVLNSEKLSETRYSQPALFAVEYALARLWLDAGVRPAFLLGHSLGEYVAACIGGVFSLEDALKLMCCRGRLMQELTPEGSMLAVRASPEHLAALLERPLHELPLAAHNSPEACVLSGEVQDMTELQHLLQEKGLHVTRLKVNRAFHSSLMEPMLDAFLECAEQVRYHLPEIPVVSNLTGQIAGPEIATAAYWIRQVRQPVQFLEGVRTLQRQGCDVWIEVGAHPVLGPLVQETVPEACCVPGLQRGQDDLMQWMRGLARHYTAGGSFSWEQWSRVHSEEALYWLPLYPFVPDRHWFTPLNGPSTPETLQADVLTKPSHSLSEQILALPSEQARVRLMDHLFALLTHALRMDETQKSEIKDGFAHLPFHALGLDSLLAVELRNRIMKDLSIQIPLKHWFGVSTPTEVVNVMYHHLLIQPLRKTTVQAAETSVNIERLTL